MSENTYETYKFVLNAKRIVCGDDIIYTYNSQSIIFNLPRLEQTERLICRAMGSEKFNSDYQIIRNIDNNVMIDEESRIQGLALLNLMSYFQRDHQLYMEEVKRLCKEHGNCITKSNLESFITSIAGTICWNTEEEDFNNFEQDLHKFCYVTMAFMLRHRQKPLFPWPCARNKMAISPRRTKPQGRVPTQRNEKLNIESNEWDDMTCSDDSVR